MCPLRRTTIGMECGRKRKIRQIITVLRVTSYSLDLVSTTSFWFTVLPPPSPPHCPSRMPGMQPPSHYAPSLDQDVCSKRPYPQSTLPLPVSLLCFTLFFALMSAYRLTDLFIYSVAPPSPAWKTCESRFSCYSQWSSQHLDPCRTPSGISVDTGAHVSEWVNGSLSNLNGPENIQRTKVKLA